MPKYAVIDGTKVVNTILADSVQDAELATGFLCIEYTDEPAEPGGTYENGRFISVKPYSSWILNQEFNWVPPLPYPGTVDEKSKIYFWSEDTVSWVEVKQEQSAE